MKCECGGDFKHGIAEPMFDGYQNYVKCGKCHKILTFMQIFSKLEEAEAKAAKMEKEKSARDIEVKVLLEGQTAKNKEMEKEKSARDIEVKVLLEGQIVKNKEMEGKIKAIEDVLNFNSFDCATKCCIEQCPIYPKLKKAK